MPVFVVVGRVGVEISNEDVIGPDLKTLPAPRTAIKLLRDTEAESQSLSFEGDTLDAHPAVGKGVHGSLVLFVWKM